MIFDRIQSLAISHGMNLTDLSKAVNVSAGNVSDWKSGRAVPSLEKLLRIADYFSVSMDYLTERDDRYPAMTEDTVELAKIYNALGREGKTMVMSAAYAEKRRISETQ